MTGTEEENIFLFWNKIWGLLPKLTQAGFTSKEIYLGASSRDRLFQYMRNLVMKPTVCPAVAPRKLGGSRSLELQGQVTSGGCIRLLGPRTPQTSTFPPFGGWKFKIKVRQGWLLVRAVSLACRWLLPGGCSSSRTRVLLEGPPTLRPH